MKTIFPKKNYHIPKWFIIDASNKTLGRLSTEISNLLRGKYKSFYTPFIDQGNFVIVLNSNEIKISGKKFFTKIYYRNSQRPGSLKKEIFKNLINRIPTRIIEKAVWGMLPKTALGRKIFNRLYIYKNNNISFLKSKSFLINNKNYIFIN